MKAPQNFTAQTTDVETAIATASRHHPDRVTGEQERYTPLHIIEAAHRVMGGIDVDPCAEPLNRANAAVYYTQVHDGLEQTWVGRLWMNPPYGRNVIDPWAARYLAHIQHSEGMALFPVRTSSPWFQRLLVAQQRPANMFTQRYPHRLLFCFIRGRLVFLNEDYRPNENSAPFSSVITYSGPHTARFVNVFKYHGTVISANHYTNDGEVIENGNQPADTNQEDEIEDS